MFGITVLQYEPLAFWYFSSSSQINKLVFFCYTIEFMPLSVMAVSPGFDAPSVENYLDAFGINVLLSE